MWSFSLNICLLLFVPVPVLTRLILANLLTILVLVAGVGTVGSLEMILLGLSRPASQQSSVGRRL